MAKKKGISMHKVLKFILMLLVVGIGFWLVNYLQLTKYLSIDELRQTIQQYGAYGPLVFMGIYAVAVTFFLPATPLTLAAGIIFGPALGLLYIIGGAITGATISFIIARSLGESLVENILKGRFKKMHEWDEKIRENGLAVVLTLRLIPLFPFSVLNYGLGLTEVKFKHFFVGTLFGMIPASFIYAYLGDSVADLSYLNIILSVVLILFLGLIGLIYRKLTHKLKKNHFDLIVIGAGAAGLNVAVFMNKLGFKVMLVDKAAKNVGGDCLNYGCVPSKALIHIARKFSAGKDTEAYGGSAPGKADIKKVMAYIKARQAIFRKHESVDYFEKQGIHMKIGEAKFTGKHHISIGDEKFCARKIVLATGSRPRKLTIPGSAKVKMLTNETIFELDTLPKSLVVIGGGPIGVEMAQAFNYLGSNVTIIQNKGTILPREDKKIAMAVEYQMRKEGIDIKCGSTVKEFVGNNKLKVTKKSGEKNEIIDCDAVLVSIGRELNSNGLDLEKAGVKMDGRKIIVDEYLQTTNPKVLVCGDIAGMHQFTHAAELHAGVLLSNLFSPIKKRLNNDYLGWVTYTYPEIATFGLSEEQLEKRGVVYEVLENDFTEDDRAIVDEYPPSYVKLFVSGGKIRGGSMAAPRAGEIVQELMLANTLGIPLKKIFTKNYPYPIATRINKRVIGNWMSKKITPTSKMVLHILFKLKN